jgi:NodT family efflux transporter outer membrane factor (OMF) lipoprotein
VSPDWWHLFHSAELDAVVEDALTNNAGLSAAQASLRASQNNLRSGYGIFYPAIDANASATRQRNSVTAIGQKGSGVVFNLFTLSTSVTYALDLFGGQRRLVEALHAQVDVARATEQATYLTLSANVVNTMIAEAAYRAEIDATRQLIELERQQVHLAEVRAEAGTAPYSNVLSLRSQLASSEAGIPALEQKLTQSDDLLATLAGRKPAEWNTPKVDLQELTLPSDLPLSLPSDLVRQRPDILAAEATAHQASANVGVATASLFPSVTLSAGAGTVGNSVSSLFSSNGGVWNIGANASAPLFEGGTLWYKRKAAIDNYQQATASYRQTVLGAFEQVADTLRALEHDAHTLDAENRALADAAEALRLVQANYQAGLSTYLDVLNADDQYHQAQVADLAALAIRYQDTVALFVALGGGWWNTPSRSVSTVGAN